MKVGIFFTYGVSLKTWNEFGLLQREISLYNEIVEKGVDLTFFTYGDKEDFNFQDDIPKIKIVPIYSKLKRPSNKVLRFLHSFIVPFLLRNEFENYDLYKTKQLMGAWVPLMLKLFFGVKVIVRTGFEPNDFAKKQNQPLIYRLVLYLVSFFSYNFSDINIMATDADKKYVLANFLSSANKFRIFPNWVDTELFNSDTSICNSQRAVTVCRLDDQKNLYNTIKAFADSKIGLDIIGHGPLFEKLNTYARGIKADVRFLGRAPNSELPSILSSYSVFTFCSFYEGNPKALLEAMSCGKIIIATNVPGIREIVISNKNGLLSNCESDNILKNIQAVFSNINDYLYLGENAAKFIRDNYSLKEAARREVALYREISING